MRRLTAGAGYKYLLKHTASGDCDRPAGTALTAYYVEDGYPAGRWVGAGLAGLNAGTGITPGTTVAEEAMANLFGNGRDPISAVPLGRAYPTYPSVTERIAARTAELPTSMGIVERAAAVETLTRVELAKPTRTAVAGFDCTFTVPKSASTVWALGNPAVQAAVAAAHRAAVDDTLTYLEATALFTRTGTHSCAQVPTRGMVAAAFDHWDTRTGDPNLHTHVVIANKVQGPDGVWRSVDSRALHHVVVEVSELYDNLFADQLARRLPVRWGWRHRGAQRTPAFEVDGIGDDLLAVFSTRSTQIEAAMTTAMAQFIATHARRPNRVEVTRLRQQATRATRPTKTRHSLRDYLLTWRRRGSEATGRTPEQLVAAALNTSRTAPLTSAQVADTVIGHLAAETIEQVLVRRSTWTRSNLLAETARATRGLRMASTADRLDLHTRVAEVALERCVSLAAPEVFTVPAAYLSPDGTSVFARPAEDRFTDLRILDAETRLLAATDTVGAPVARRADARAVTSAPLAVAGQNRPVHLAADQAIAVTAIATSGRRLDVLVGPAGTGKTTTLLALRRVWEATHGPGSVVGLAPSAAAAGQLADALEVGCENTSKWIYESAGQGHTRRNALQAEITRLANGLHPCRDSARIGHLTTAQRALRAESRAWALQPGQLLIVDEASLAGTFTLDTLLHQATRADAKVLLVGDHAQLSAVDAGGAFGLLAERGRPATLTSLWRFTHRWEAHATRQLRIGNPAALDAYAEHDRITSGPAEAMLEAAYTAWQDSELAGVSAILLAADTHTVDALNTRAHADRLADFAVAPTGITTTSGTTITAGDRILTRRNARHLRLATGGYVRNGDLWDVAATHPDGSLTVVKTTRTGHAAGQNPQAVHLDAAYVAEHVDLGYATTTHRAQGITVEHAHVLAAPGMARENLYVAMTRGRQTNHVYAATDVVDPTCDQIPDPHAAPAARDVLERILRTSVAELSATQTIAADLDHAASLERLEPIRDTLATDAATRRWMRDLPSCGLTTEQASSVADSPARGPLVAALRQGERTGYPMADVLARLIASRPVDDPANPAHDVAAVLHERVTRWLTTQDEGRHNDNTSHDVTPEPLDHTDPAARAITELNELITGRITNLTELAISARPAWLQPLGDEPELGPARQDWERQISALVAHRDLNHLDQFDPAASGTSSLNRDSALPMPATETEWSLRR
ncbi:MAG: MobF family relaxase [Cellulomonas sp.]